MTVPVIHGWMLQWYWYVPGAVKVTEKVAPGLRLPSLNAWAPVGMLRDVTVWTALSSLVHVTVLLTPMTTVMLLGLKFRLELAPVPLGIETFTTATALPWMPKPGGTVCPV